MTANIPDLVAKLKQAQAALGDGRDARSDNERQQYQTRYNTIQLCLSNLSSEQVAYHAQRVADLEAKRAAVVEKEQALLAALSEVRDLSTLDGIEADKERERQWQLERALARLREGSLQMSPSECYEPLAHIDVRLAEAKERRDQAQGVLDYAINAARTLLGEMVTTS